jgi:uncharacterized membrane protein YfcA
MDGLYTLSGLLVGLIVGVNGVGSHLSSKVPEAILRPLLATMLLIIGTQMVMY